MNDRNRTAANRRLHKISRRIVILAAPPFDEINVVGVFQVFGTANQLFHEHASPYRIQVASANPESMITGYSGLSLVPHLYYKDVRDNVDTLLLASGPVSHSDVDMHLLQWVIRLSPKVRRLGFFFLGAFFFAENRLPGGGRGTNHLASVQQIGAPFSQRLACSEPNRMPVAER